MLKALEGKFADEVFLKEIPRDQALQTLCKKR